MTYKLIDKLRGFELEPGDVVSTLYDDEVSLVTIKSIEYLEEGYDISFLDEYEDEELTYHIEEDEWVELYMFVDE